MPAQFGRLLRPLVLLPIQVQLAHGLQTGSEEKRARAAERSGALKKNLIKYGIIGVVGVVMLLSLAIALSHLWAYAIGLLIVGGIGAGGYFYLKPKVIALKERTTARLTAKKTEQAAVDKEQAAKNAVAAKQQKLEDELAALRKKAGG